MGQAGRDSLWFGWESSTAYSDGKAIPSGSRFDFATKHPIYQILDIRDWYVDALEALGQNCSFGSLAISSGYCLGCNNPKLTVSQK